MRRFRVPPQLLVGFVLGLVVVLLTRSCGGGGPASSESAPAPTLTPPSASASVKSDTGVPALWPVPRSVRRENGSVPIGRSVAVRADAGTDASTLDAVTRALRAGGAREVRVGDAPRRGELLVTVGTTAAGLPPEGYTLTVATTSAGPRVTLSSSGADGAFHAAQTLAQLIRPVGSPSPRSALPAVSIRDWPATATRGIVEGFYGTPWTQRERLGQLDFAARWKLNTYVYTPKDDPYLRDRWRDEYPTDALTGIRTLAARAAADHVTFVYALSPGKSVCYSSAGDRAALVTKLRQLWDEAGVRAFAIPLDDIGIDRWNCARDATVYGTGRAAVARAQAALLNGVRRDFLSAHPDAAPLITVPTEYDGSRASAYKTTLAAELDKDVTVMWTGPLVVSPALSTAQAQEAARLYNHRILVWDNYPVNDYTAPNLLLGPYTGRDTTLPGAVAGLLANPMNQAAASDPSLFSTAAYTWNPTAYRPAEALDAGLSALADGDGTALAALRAFADVNRASRLDTTQAPELAALITAYWKGGPKAEDALRTRLTILANARTTVPSALRTSASPWLSATHDWAEAALSALGLRTGRSTRAEVESHRTAARSHTVLDWQDRTRTVEVGTGVLDTFVARVLGG
ncbi:beta-N-acetylglucosaminidase domain-containing protein [Streptomyces sasae]|uniref:beta-N-acetylglucosaminidase domain-containing protein n=1 Tax=Streptomyces sasae TaxID=1266772 RepID=UPI00293123C3|nr:beta-N-acetylglucosaminidase domain-containing protein [Streptomyces sasae]